MSPEWKNINSYSLRITLLRYRYGFLNGADGDEAAPRPTPIDVLRRRETKWLEMLSDWDGYMLKHYKKVMQLIRIWNCMRNNTKTI